MSEESLFATANMNTAITSRCCSMRTCHPLGETSWEVPTDACNDTALQPPTDPTEAPVLIHIGVSRNTRSDNLR